MQCNVDYFGLCLSEFLIVTFFLPIYDPFSMNNSIYGNLNTKRQRAHSDSFFHPNI